MSTEEETNKALACRFLEAREKGNLEVVEEMIATDYVIHARLLPDQEPGREGAIRAIAQLSAAVSTSSVHFEDQVAAGDNVVSRFIVHATHDRGSLWMLPLPAGR